MLAAHGGSIVWSPFSNLALYGETTDVATAIGLGIKVALGPDWSPTASKNLLHELKVARIVSDAPGHRADRPPAGRDGDREPGHHPRLAPAARHPAGRLAGRPGGRARHHRRPVPQAGRRGRVRPRPGRGRRGGPVRHHRPGRRARPGGRAADRRRPAPGAAPGHRRPGPGAGPAHPGRRHHAAPGRAAAHQGPGRGARAGRRLGGARAGHRAGHRPGRRRGGAGHPVVPRAGPAPGHRDQPRALRRGRARPGRAVHRRRAVRLVRRADRPGPVGHPGGRRLLHDAGEATPTCRRSCAPGCPRATAGSPPRRSPGPAGRTTTSRSPR